MSKTTYSPKYEKPELANAIAALGDLVKGVHAACKAVKPISRRDFDNLVDSIKQHGLIRPIEVNAKGWLVDGRCRVLACHVADVEITDADIVETSVPPWAIAESNNARRHLSRDQKTMAAVDLLAKERKFAAKKKSQGAAKGNLSKRTKLGTDTVPSEGGKPPRAPRAIEIVASQESIPRDKLALAEKVKNADLKLAAKVAAGDVSLSEAAVKAGVKQAKRKASPTPRTSDTASSIDDEAVSLGGNTTLFSDEWTSITDDAQGTRVVKNRQCTSFTHKAMPYDMFVFARQGKWVTVSANGVDAKAGNHGQRPSPMHCHRL